MEQTGKANIVVTAFSTSVDFVSGFFNIKASGLVGKTTMVADVKAAKKTWRLDELISSTFDNVYLCENHSKVVLLYNDRYKVSVITSQNHTYGGRIEATFVTTDPKIFDDLMGGAQSMIDPSLKIK